MKKLIISLLLCLGLSACSDTINGKSIAEPQIAVFHSQLDAQQYDSIYDSASDEFKNAASREKMSQLLSAINKKLGTVKSSKIVNWRVNTFNMKTNVILVSETEFEKGTGTETFTFRVSGSNANLMGYNINSLDMMTQ